MIALFMIARLAFVKILILSFRDDGKLDGKVISLHINACEMGRYQFFVAQ